MPLNSTAGRCRPPQKGLDFRCRPVSPERVQDADCNQVSGAEAAIFEAQNGFSAVDSGIGRAPARLRPVARDRGNAQLQVLVAELETKARRQTRRPETLAAGV
jgi:hypothetical protein